MQRILTLTLSAALLPAAASAQIFYGTDEGAGDENFLFDTSSGVSTGPAWTGGEAWGIAYDGANQVTYANNGAALTSSPAGMLGGAATSVGTLMYQGATRTVTALAFSGGQLWGSPNIATEGLYTFDLVTLDGTLTYTYPSSTIDIGGLDFDAATGLLYGSNDSGAYLDPQGMGGAGVVVFDLSGAAVTETWTYPYPAGEVDLDGLAFDPTGAGSVYLIEDEPSPMHRYDISTMAYDPAPFMTR